MKTKQLFLIFSIILMDVIILSSILSMVRNGYDHLMMAITSLAFVNGILLVSIFLRLRETLKERTVYMKGDAEITEEEADYIYEPLMRD